MVKIAERKSGWYWVKIVGVWIVAHYEPRGWRAIGWPDRAIDVAEGWEWDEVGPRIEPPDCDPYEAEGI